MISITNLWTSQMQKLANFIVLEGRTRGSIGTPYTNDICAHWRFVDEEASLKSSDRVSRCSVSINDGKISLGHGTEILEMGFTRARRYANHSSGRKYASNGSVSPCGEGASRMSKEDRQRSSKSKR